MESPAPELPGMESPASNEKMDEVARKRKREASESDEPGSSDSISSKSEGSKGKVEDHADMPAHAAGENGCDDIEKLMSCKMCSHTYHIRCLSPPLESIPEDWQCLNCSDNVDLLEPILNFKKPKKERSSDCSICSGAREKLRLPEVEDVQSKSLKSNSADVPNAQVESDKNETGDQEGAAISEPGICGIIIKHTPNKIKNDKLLMLREACSKLDSEIVKSVEKHNKPEEKAEETVQQPNPQTASALQATKEILESYNKSDSKALNKLEEVEEATLQQSHPEKATVDQLQATKERLDMLREKQIEKRKSKKKSAVSPSSSTTSNKQNKSSVLAIVEKDKSVALNDSKNSGKGGEIGNSSSKGLSGHDKTPPNTSSHLKNSSTLGSTSRPLIPKRVDTSIAPRRGLTLGSTPRASIAERVDTTTMLGRPSGLLRIIKPKPATWSEFELDALWIGVRRHGQGNWERILADPLLTLLRNKTPEHLSKRWEKETLKIFPSVIPLPIRNMLPAIDIERSTPPYHYALERNNRYSFPDHTTSMLMPRAIAPQPHMSGNKTYPYDVENQGLMWRSMNMPFVNNSGMSSPSYIQGSSSSSRVSQMVTTAPQMAPATNSTTTLASQIQSHNINHRSSTMRPHHALQAELETMVYGEKKSASTSAELVNEPKLLLGGYFTLPKDVVLSKKSTIGNNERGKSKSNPSQVKASKGKEPASSSEETASVSE